MTAPSSAPSLTTRPTTTRPTTTGPTTIRPAAATSVIEASGLRKRYGDVDVVAGVDLRVGAGEIFGILGANGAGKTTTVECLQGLRRPDGGRLRVLGLDPIADRSRLRAVIGSQLQDAALPDRLRVGEAIALFDRDGRSDATAHLEPWGLAAKVRTSFADLSGGQRQRLFIALALLNRPQVVFLDELTQGLDPAARRDVWHAVRRVRDEGTTVVLVSHFADEIEALCDRVAVMDGGRVVDEGTPREITDRHAPWTMVSFTVPPDRAGPRPAIDLDGIGRLPGVERVEHTGDHVCVVGRSTMIGPVCAATIGSPGAAPSDPLPLTVTHPGLDDALVNLIGGRR